MNEDIKAGGVSPEQSDLDVPYKDRKRGDSRGAISTRKNIGGRSRECERYSIRSHGKTVSNKESKRKLQWPAQNESKNKQQGYLFPTRKKKNKTWIPNELKLRSKKYEKGRKRCDKAEKRHDSMMQMFVYQNQLMLSIISKLADKQCFLVLTCFHHRHFVCVKVFVI